MDSLQRERLTNIISWVGFGYPVLLIISMQIDEITADDSLFRFLSFSGWSSYGAEDFYISLTVFSICVAINYLAIGKLRFLPFKINEMIIKKVGIALLFVTAIGIVKLSIFSINRLLFNN
jgi:hypothetical protein